MLIGEDNMHAKICEDDLKWKKNVRDSLTGLKREIGEYNLSKFPIGMIDWIFENVEIKGFECKLKEEDAGTTAEFNKDGYESIDDKYTDIMKAYDNLLKEKGMNSDKVFEILHKYYNSIKNDKYADHKKEAFKELIEKTCKLTYIDYDGNNISSFEEHPHYQQSEVNHSYVGTYKFIMRTPIPTGILKVMKKGIRNKLKEELSLYPGYQEFNQIKETLKKGM